MTQHTLYRFFDKNDTLLYVGITNNPSRRFSQHKGDKDWWDNIAHISLEHHETREQLLSAERSAITSESPLHNVQHNSWRQTIGHACPSSAFLRVGDFVALGLQDGTCPVGEVVRNDGTMVVLRLKNFLFGYYSGPDMSYRIETVEQVCFAQRESDGIVMDEHLGSFQTQWESARNTATQRVALNVWGE